MVSAGVQEFGFEFEGFTGPRPFRRNLFFVRSFFN